MARINNTLWQRYKYQLNGLLIILSAYYFYQSLHPTFPDIWPAKNIGVFTIAPMPYNLEAPYFHDGHYTKDFFLMFNQGSVEDIRQAYLNIGSQALSLEQLEQGSGGILHGSQHGQEVHAISPEVIKSTDKMWLTIQDWQGKQMVTSWDLPDVFLP